MNVVECTGAFVIDKDEDRPKTVVTCAICGYSAESWGCTEKSTKRSCWLLSSDIEHPCTKDDEKYFYQVSKENITDNMSETESEDIPF